MGTHRVTYKWIERSDPDAHIGRVYFTVGDEIDPTDEELEKYGDRLEPVEESESGAQDDSNEDGSQPADEEDDSESAEADGAESLQGIDLDGLSYSQLQELAGNFDDVHGNLPKSEMREKLAAKQ